MRSWLAQRISRLLKSLGELSLDYLAAPFLLFILSEQSEHGYLNSPGLKVRVRILYVRLLTTVQSSMDRWCLLIARNGTARTDPERTGG